MTWWGLPILLLPVIEDTFTVFAWYCPLSGHSMKGINHLSGLRLALLSSFYCFPFVKLFFWTNQLTHYLFVQIAIGLVFQTLCRGQCISIWKVRHMSLLQAQPLCFRGEDYYVSSHIAHSDFTDDILTCTTILAAMSMFFLSGHLVCLLTFFLSFYCRNHQSYQSRGT